MDAAPPSGALTACQNPSSCAEPPGSSCSTRMIAFCSYGTTTARPTAATGPRPAVVSTTARKARDGRVRLFTYVIK
jgi:hypothetical protein